MILLGSFQTLLKVILTVKKSNIFFYYKIFSRRCFMLFEHLLDLQKNLDSLFERDLFPGTTFSRGVYPAVNMFEKDDALVLKAEMSGIDKKDIKIEIKNDKLSLTGERKSYEKEDRTYHRKERAEGTFRRQINLPYKVNAEKVCATLEDGVLTIELAKAEESRPRLISVA
jgi:HSP20 family protein